MSPIFVPTPVDPDDDDGEVQPPLMHPVYSHGFTLVGSDGSNWDLVDGPVYILEGASGFGFPDPEHQWSETPAADGAVHKGLRYSTRDFSLPLEIDGRNLRPQDWRDLERRLWKSLNPRGECMLIVTSPTGITRHLPFRYSSGGDDSYNTDPQVKEQNFYSLECSAGDPFWRGETIVLDYGLAEGGPTTFPGPPFYFSESTAIQSTTITNPGDEDSWPRWTITGPFSSFTVGIGDATVSMTAIAGPNDTRVIDMDPRHRSIKDQDGNLKWSEATDLSFAAVPAGTQVPLTMSLSGGTVGQSSVLLEFDSRYLRAFS